MRASTWLAAAAAALAAGCGQPSHNCLCGAANGILVVSPPSLAFGSAAVGGSQALSLRLQNAGDAPVAVLAFGLDGGAGFSIDAGTGSLGVGEARSVSVVFTPTAPGPVQGELSVPTDSALQPVVTVPLQGVGQ